MKIAFVVHFFDFRNDVRRLITEVAKNNEVVLFVKPNHLKEVESFELANTSIRVIDERLTTIKNRALD